MANTYKNIVITPNTGSTTGDPTIVFSGGDSNTNTDVTLRVYPTTNGTLSVEGSAGQLFSITNDLSNTIYTVNDVSGLPLIEVNVVSQQITFGQYYSNVGIGTNASVASKYKLDVIGGANISLPNLTVGGTNVMAAIVAANANAVTLSTNVNVLAATFVAANANTVSLSTNVATLAATFVSANANNVSLAANVATLAATFVAANANTVSLSTNVNILASSFVSANASKLTNTTVTLAGALTTTGQITANSQINITPTGGDEGGEIQLQSTGSNTNWSIDAYQNNFRIFARSGTTVSNVNLFHATGGTIRLGVNRTDPIYTVDVAGAVNTSSILVNGSPILSRVVDYASVTSNLTIDSNITDIATCSTSSTGTLTIDNPTGTPVDGQRIMIRIITTAAARTLSFGNQFVGSTDLPLPASTSNNLYDYFSIAWNSPRSQWQMISRVQGY